MKPCYCVTLLLHSFLQPTISQTLEKKFQITLSEPLTSQILTAAGTPLSAPCYCCFACWSSCAAVFRTASPHELMGCWVAALFCGLSASSLCCRLQTGLLLFLVSSYYCFGILLILR